MKLTPMTRAALCVSCAALCAVNMPAQKPIISEDFETGKIDPGIWEVRTTGTVEIKVVSDESAHGKYALRVHYPVDAGRVADGPAYGYLVMPHLPEALRGHLYARAYVKVSQLPGAHTQMLWAGIPSFPVAKYQEIGINVPVPRPAGPPAAAGAPPAPSAPPAPPQSVQPQWVVIYQQNQAKTRQEGRGEDVWRADVNPYGKWMLVEWEMNDNPTYTKIWVDGKQVSLTQKDKTADFAQFHWPAGSDSDKGLVGGYAEAGFGARPWGKIEQPFDVLIDDIVIDNKPIGAVKK